MEKEEAVFALYTAKGMPSLSLDELLVLQGLSHRKYRNWLKANNYQLYKPTAGLCNEIHSLEDMPTRQKLTRLYHMPMLEVNACLYTKKPARHSRMRHERADHMRAAGATELDLLNEALPVDIPRLSKEITERRARGESIAVLAELYGYSPGRISQLDAHQVKKPRLTKEDKYAIRNSTKSAADLAKQYNTTRNTIYVLRREQECKNT